MCVVFLCFRHFPIWCPQSGVVLDCLDSLSLPSSLLYNKEHTLKQLVTIMLPMSITKNKTALIVDSIAIYTIILHKVT